MVLQTQQHYTLTFPVNGLTLHGDMTLPDRPEHLKGLVLFAHGSGSSRLSPRNQYVAYELNQAGLATCLFDLLTLEEEEVDQVSRQYRFDISLLAERLTAVTQWLQTQWEPLAETPLPIGYFGASTGAAAALIAAAQQPDIIQAVVSRGGRPDLAESALRRVQAATLFLVGSLDTDVLRLNDHAYRQLPDTTHKDLVVIEGASHLFEEPGTLSQVAQYAAQWFEKHLRPGQHL